MSNNKRIAAAAVIVLAVVLSLWFTNRTVAPKNSTMADVRAEAEAGYREAIKVARGQEARLLELRAATGLARLWGENGKRGVARELLAPVYDAFSEGFDTPDLTEAKALLNELA